MTNRPKVLMLTTQLGYGGAETSFIRLANYLMQSADVTVVLFTENYGKGAYSEGHLPLSAKVILLDSPQPCSRLQRWWNRASRLRRLKKQHDVCISFLSGPNILNTLAGYNHRTIVSLRGPRMHDANTPKWMRRIFQYILDPITLNLAAKIVVVSSGLLNEVHQLGGPWALKKAEVISPFVIPEEHFGRAQETPPEKFLSLKNQLLIVAAGRISIEKNFQHLIPVFAKISRENPGAKLLLVGDGPMMNNVRALCSEANLAIDNFMPGISSVIFTGYQKNPLMFMKLAKVFAFPSGTEGVPNILLEALSAEVLIVAADAAWGARSVLSNGNLYQKEPYPTQQVTPVEYGILMPRIDDPRYYDEWAETLGKCLKDDTWSKLYVPKSMGRVREYDMAKIAKKWEKLIHELITAK